MIARLSQIHQLFWRIKESWMVIKRTTTETRKPRFQFHLGLQFFFRQKPRAHAPSVCKGDCHSKTSGVRTLPPDPSLYPPQSHSVNSAWLHLERRKTHHSFFCRSMYLMRQNDSSTVCTKLTHYRTELSVRWPQNGIKIYLTCLSFH